jgi:hypothetical protein
VTTVPGPQAQPGHGPPGPSSAAEPPPLLLTHLAGWYATNALALGHRSGLLAALLDGGGTAADIAARAGVDRRNALEWLRAVTAAGHVGHEDGFFRATPGLAGVLSEESPLDARAVLDLVLAAPGVVPAVLAAMASGAGVPPDTYGELAAAGGRINSPAYASVLVGDWIAGVPGLARRLTEGARVAELAPGGGDAAVLVGTAFPSSTVVGWDVVAPPRQDLPPNVRLEAVDARELPDDGPFQLVYSLDSFHHFGAPGPVLEQVRRVLAPDGVLLLAESALTGDLDVDRHDPFAVVAYTAGLYYCLQENLAAGGDGRSGGDGTGWIEEAMVAAGFVGVTSRSTDSGYTLLWGTRGP